MERQAEDRRAGVRRAGILAAIRASSSGLGIRALSEATGIHENTVRFHLERLVADGLVERRAGRSRGPGRPPLTFVALPWREDVGGDNYELIARVLTTHLEGAAEDPVGVAEEAGRVFGRGRGVRDRTGDALGELVEVLDEAGFLPEPVIDAEGRAVQVRVHHCPFGALAREDRSVPCGVHLGLMRGVLEASGGELAVDRLEPFVSPTMCVAHLARTGAEAGAATG